MIFVDWFRIKHTIRMYLTLSPMKRAEYLKKRDIFHHVGDNCMVMFRKIPLYPKLISMGDNVWIASQVSFIPHDVIHYMLNYCISGEQLKENIGCIDIKDNVFIGSNSTILPDVSIGPNTIVGAGTLINKTIGTGVYAGVPAKYVCSLDELIEKRKSMEQISIVYDKKEGGLSKVTVDACWERLYRKQSNSEKKGDER